MKNHESKSSPLADAVAGVIGSLVAMGVFYPMDTIKINLQAASSSDDNENDIGRDKNIISALDSLIKLVSCKDNSPSSTLMIMNLFKGIHIKGIHTITSSFSYFYFYSMIQARHRKRHYQTSSTPYQIRAGERMVMASIAAILNVLLTLPLDVISARQQTSKGNIRHCKNEFKDRRNMTAQKFVISEESREKVDEIINDSGLKIKEGERKDNGKYSGFSRYFSYWNGLGPAILLCSNPAINFTIFDIMKIAFIKQRRRTQNNGGVETLGMFEAFLIGMIAKSCATILTYPLIRAKVMMMVQPKEESMVQVLKSIFREDGMRGFYKGCSLQLVHTVLKSALLMMVRERITLTTRKLL